MKKTLLITSLIFSGSMAFAQKNELFIGTSWSHGAKDTTRTFLVFGVDKDIYEKDFISHIGQPETSTMGILSWKNVTIEGLGKDLQVKLKDGIMTTDLQNKSSCFALFTGAEDKQKKLAALREDQERWMEIEFTDNQNNNIVITKTLEQASLAFLEKVYKKD